jgi:PEP-CTERM motif
MFRRTITLLVALTLVVAAAATAQGALTITLDPVDGVISGVAGQTVGWGITVSNDSLEWLWINDSTFSNGVTGPWAQYANLSGYMPPVAPGAVVTTPFNSALNFGAGSFTIDPGSLPGDVAAGVIDFTYDLYVSDPTLGGTPDNNGAYNGVSATVVTTPEPSTYALLCLSLGVVGFVRRKVVKGEE